MALRERQVELTRDLILESLAELIGEGHLTEFSMQDVADNAGVSLRTVYRHFPSREALLEGFTPWVGDRLRAAGAMEFPSRAEDIGPLLRQRFAACERLAPLVNAFSKFESATGYENPLRAKSLRTIRAALTEVTADLEPDLAEAVVWTIRTIWSATTWVAMHEAGGLDAIHGGTAASWAIDVLIEALRDGRGPTLGERGA